MFSLRLSLIIISLSLSSMVFATSTVANLDCPQQFTGTVQDIVDESAFDSSFSKIKVIFKRLEVIKGNVPQNIIVEVLKHGPFDFKKNEIYSVQLQDGRLCWAEKK